MPIREVLETERLVLREFTLADLDSLHGILSDPVTMSFWPKPFDRAATQRWIERARESYATHGFGRYAVTLKQTGELIGDCGFLRVEVNGVPENDLGYILAKNHWGRGYATEAARGCLRYGFEQLRLARIVANMESKHLKSKKVAETIGMRFECEFINQRNRNLPTLLFSQTSSEQRQP